MLSACSESGSEGEAPRPDYVGLFTVNSNAESELVAHLVDPTAGSVSSLNGNLNRQNDTIAIGSNTASVDPSFTSGVLNQGGTIAFTNGQTTYITQFSLQPATGTPTFGVVGIPTQSQDLPEVGSTTYLGTDNAVMQIIDGTAVFDVIGAASVTANFNTNSVAMTFSDLDGIRSTGTSRPTTADDVATITITDATLSNGVFSGGQASVTSTQLAATLSGAETTMTSGGLYGPEASEVGGAFIVDDTNGNGSLLIQGWFTAAD